MGSYLARTGSLPQDGVGDTFLSPHPCGWPIQKQHTLHLSSLCCPKTYMMTLVSTNHMRRTQECISLLSWEEAATQRILETSPNAGCDGRVIAWTFSLLGGPTSVAGGAARSPSDKQSPGIIIQREICKTGANTILLASRVTHCAMYWRFNWRLFLGGQKPHRDTHRLFQTVADDCRCWPSTFRALPATVHLIQVSTLVLSPTWLILANSNFAAISRAGSKACKLHPCA